MGQLMLVVCVQECAYVQERIAAIMKHYEADKEKLQKIRALLVGGSLLTLLLLYTSLCTGTQES